MSVEGVHVCLTWVALIWNVTTLPLVIIFSMESLYINVENMDS